MAEVAETVVAPIEKIEDMQGLKFRAYNASLEKFAKLAGAAPVQVEVPDIPQAFATGRVESMITSPSTGVNSKAWDFVKNYYDIQAWLPKNIVVVNKAAFDALPEATQAAILEAAATAEARGWQMSREETATKTDELGAAGMNVSEPSDDLLSSLKQLGSQLLIDWQETAGDDALGIINAFKG
jgi:TRAP-type C4-dicarboxylate transport system substrate-binding protein